MTSSSPAAGTAPDPLRAVDTAGPPASVRITAANVAQHRGAADVSPIAGREADLWRAFDRSQFDAAGVNGELVPIARLVSHKDSAAEPAVLGGTKADPRTTAARRMAEAMDGQRPPRAPLRVEAQADGTFTVLDGNATMQAAALARWSELPVITVEPRRAAIATPRQQAQLDRVFERSTEKTAELAGHGQAVANEVGGIMHLGPLKSPERILEKAVAYDGDVSRVKDVYRGTIEVARLDEVPRALESLQRHFDVVKVKDRIANPTKDGYRDILTNVRLSDGTIGEMQIAVAPMVAAKEKAHALYAQERRLDAIAPDSPRAQELAERQRAIYGEAWSEVMRATSASNSSGLRTHPNERAVTGSPGAAGRTSPDGQIMKALPEGSMTTGTSSTSKKELPAAKSDARITRPTVPGGAATE